jgi:hypothetical protein
MPNPLPVPVPLPVPPQSRSPRATDPSRVPRIWFLKRAARPRLARASRAHSTMAGSATAAVCAHRAMSRSRTTTPPPNNLAVAVAVAVTVTVTVTVAAAAAATEVGDGDGVLASARRVFCQCHSEPGGAVNNKNGPHLDPAAEDAYLHRSLEVRLHHIRQRLLGLPHGPDGQAWRRVPHGPQCSSGAVPHGPQCSSDAVPHGPQCSSGAVPHGPQCSSGAVPHGPQCSSDAVPHGPQCSTSRSSGSAS